MSTVLVSIQIKPYLKRFLIAKSENKQEPLKFPRKSDYNVMLINLVTNYNTLDQIALEDRQHVIDYFKSSAEQIPLPDSLTIILPFNKKKDVRSYNYLSEKSRIEFRNEVRMDFNFEFSRFLHRGMKQGDLRTDIVKEFKKMYRIGEDELDSGSLYRHSSRILQEIQYN
jgi:hypothetical protein